LRAGFPHSDIAGSKPARSSPTLFAACHVLHRLSVPRHPPNALIALDTLMHGHRYRQDPRHKAPSPSLHPYPHSLMRYGHPMTDPKFELSRTCVQPTRTLTRRQDCNLSSRCKRTNPSRSPGRPAGALRCLAEGSMIWSLWSRAVAELVWWSQPWWSRTGSNR
jgi:hypothetical protein